MRFALRPWGRTGWILDRTRPTTGWSLLGSLSSEARGLAVWELLRQRRELGITHLLRIRAPDGHPRAETLSQLIDREQRRLLDGGGVPEMVRSHYLLERHADIASAAEAFLSESGPSIVIDITSFPKRFFFPLLRFVLGDASKKDILVTYTLPERYSVEPLHQDVEAPRYLPSFMPAITDDDDRLPHVLAIAVGFESPGLVQVLEEEQGDTVHYLFPFPAPPPLFRGTWDFLDEGMSVTDDRRSHVEGVSSRDPGSTFEKLIGITDRGRHESVLAPYGPKPVSLGMCLFSIGPGRESSCVRYAQPKFYNPEYSVGTATDGDGIVSYAYVIRMGGRDYFC